MFRPWKGDESADLIRNLLQPHRILILVRLSGPLKAIVDGNERTTPSAFRGQQQMKSCSL